MDDFESSRVRKMRSGTVIPIRSDSRGSHRHKAMDADQLGFAVCVAPRQCNPSAHGNIEIRERCACGAFRALNINQSHIERSPWRHAAVDRDWQ